MSEQVKRLFDDMPNMLKKLKKATYEENMERFIQLNGPYFDEVTTSVEQAEDRDGAGKQIADRFVTAVEEKYSKNGKISGRMQADLSFFMIYYVFPAILETKKPCADLVADALCTEWSKRIAHRTMGYTTYEKMRSSFREKIFGIF